MNKSATPAPGCEDCGHYEQSGKIAFCGSVDAMTKDDLDRSGQSYTSWPTWMMRKAGAKCGPKRRLWAPVSITTVTIPASRRRNEQDTVG